MIPLFATPHRAWLMTTPHTTKIAETRTHHTTQRLDFFAVISTHAVSPFYNFVANNRRLLHPLSPKGKLVYLGLEGLTATNHLLDAASVFQKNCVLQNEIYRVAVNEDHVATLTHTAQQLPELTEWLLPDNLPWKAPPGVLGGLRLHSGCKVVHMPSYLEGLWDWVRSTGTGSKDWVVLEDSSTTAWRSQLSEFDKVVLCAGSGLFHDSIVEEKLPIQLVRGQSIEMTLNTATCQHAMLCGKYVSPLLEKNRVLIGATHEFKEAPLDPDQVGSELRERSFDFASDLWEDGVVDRITSGFRVQSNRGKFGRIPIVGKLDVDFHDDAWIYTGLSSRGLLHHGIFGEILASKILNVESQHDHPSLDWWHGK